MTTEDKGEKSVSEQQTRLMMKLKDTGCLVEITEGREMIKHSPRMVDQLEEMSPRLSPGNHLVQWFLPRLLIRVRILWRALKTTSAWDMPKTN